MLTVASRVAECPSQHKEYTTHETPSILSLCNYIGDVNNPSMQDKTVLLKYHFAINPTNEPHLTSLLNNYFESPTTQEFEEIFMDDMNMSNALTNTWCKKVCMMKDKPEDYSLSVKKPNKENIPMVVKDIGDDLKEIAKFLVVRKKFVCKTNPNAILTIDLAEFPFGDTFVVFTFKIKIFEEDIEKVLSESSLSDLNLKPCRCKIIEYLYRHNRRLYEKLISNNSVPNLLYGSVNSTCLISGFHSQSQYTRWINSCRGNIPNVKTLATNIGCSPRRLLTFLKGRMIDRKEMILIEQFIKYSPATKERMKKPFNAQSTDILYQNYLDFASGDFKEEFCERIKANLDKIWAYSINLLYGFPIIELEVESDHVTDIENVFLQDINTGWVRVLEGKRPILKVRLSVLVQDPHIINESK